MTSPTPARNPRVSTDRPGTPAHTEFGGAIDAPIQPPPHEPDSGEKLMMVHADRNGDGSVETPELG